MSFVITTVRPGSITQISDTRESDFVTQAVISESLRKTLLFKGRRAHFVLGWVGLASTRFGHNTTDWLFKTLVEMDALELGIDQIAGCLERAATDRFAYLSTPERHKHTAFTMAGWEGGEQFACIVSNFLTVCNSVSPEIDVRHHIPTISESVAVSPRFTGVIQRFKNVKDHHYFVHVMGDFDPHTLKPHFMGLERLLKKQASSEEICGACRLVALEVAEHRATVGNNLIGVEMDSTGRPMCSFYAEDGIDDILLPPYISLNGCSTQASINTVIAGDQVTLKARAKVPVIEALVPKET
jgi:hypothetical protein